MKQRYILVLLIALFASASMNVWGTAYNYKVGPTKVMVYEETITDGYQYTFYITQDSKNTTGYTNSITYPTPTTLVVQRATKGIEGTYSTDPYADDIVGTIVAEKTFVKFENNIRYINTDKTSTFTIGTAANGHYTIKQGVLNVKNEEKTHTYAYNYCYKNADLNTKDKPVVPFEFCASLPGETVTVANSYNMHTITNVEINSNSSISGYTVSFNAKGNSSADKLDYSYTITLELNNTSDFVGTFNLCAPTNGIDPSTKLVTGSTTRYPVRTTSLTITKTGASTYTISGKWYALKDQAGTGNPYLYDFGTGVEFKWDPYKNESQMPSAMDFTSTQKAEFSLNSIEGETPIEIKIEDFESSSVFLQFNESSFNIPAGTHNVAATGVNGTIQASGGFTSPVSNCIYFFGGSYPYNYYITGGSLTVSYSDSKRKMTLKGDLTTAHGSTIHVDVTDNNPFYAEVEEITLSNVIVEATFNENENFVQLEISAENDIDGELYFHVNDIKGRDWTFVNFYSYNISHIENNQVQSQKENVITLTETSTDNFSLSATIFCMGNKKYVINNAQFTQHVPTDWDTEAAQTADFTMTASQLVEQTFADNLLSLDFVTADNNYISLAFNVTSDELAAGKYTINDTKTIGTCLASAGYRESANQPSYVQTNDQENVHYLRSGSLIVTNTNGNLGIHGTAVSYRGTNINLDIDIVRQVTLNVTDVAAKIEDNQVQLTITADGEGTAAGAFLRINSNILNGTYSTTDIDLDYSFIGVAPNTTNINGNKSNSITIESNSGTCTLNATLYGADGCTYTITNATFSFVYLLDTEDNSSELASAMDKTCDIQLGRTLYRDGYWNTLCLPFALSSLNGTPLQGAEVYRFTNAIVSAEQLDFYYEEVTAIEAGKPYIIRWTTPKTELVNPVFEDVVIAASEGQTVVGTDASFIGILKPTHLVGINLYFVGDDNYVYQPASDDATSTPSFRAYLQLNPGVPAPRRMGSIVLNHRTPTNVENVNANVNVNKILRNGQLIIIRDGKQYNAQGIQL